MAAYLVRDAGRYDVILATNFYADILSDHTSELAGGLGLAGSINANESLCAAQAQHGSAPDIAGRGVANPTSMMLSAAMLFDWLGETRHDPEFSRVGEALHSAIEATRATPATRTADLGGTLGTRAFGEAVAQKLYAG